MINKLKNLTPLKTIFLSALSILIVFLITTLMIFSIETVYRMNGKLETVVLNSEDFELLSMVEKDGVYVSSDPDPQLVLQKEMYITSVTLNIEYTLYPGEVTLYYTTKDGQGFSSDNREWFSIVEDDIYKTDLFFMVGAKSIRIDPTDLAANFMDIKSITFNEEKTFFEYFAVTPTRVYHFILYTVLLSSIAWFAKDILIKIKK